MQAEDLYRGIRDKAPVVTMHQATRRTAIGRIVPTGVKA
jgi:hypothetical protein